MPCWVLEGVIECLMAGGSPSNPLTTNKVNGLGYIAAGRALQRDSVHGL